MPIRKAACLLLIVSFLIVGLSSSPVVAEVFYAQDEAMKIAFPDVDEVQTKTFILTDEQLTTAERLARTKIDSKLFTFFLGVKDGKVINYAAIDSHNVRTFPETFMAILNPDGSIKSTVILAFHEPSEYLPSAKWLEQVEGKNLDQALKPGDDIAGILGSTLSVTAISQGIRKVLALYSVLIDLNSKP